MEKNCIETFFSKISKQAGENLIIPSGGGYFITSRKTFQIGYLKELFKL